ncbi:MAG: hypothetical protein KC897_06530 [Candidatus Omnitrophica bacterium]|nr:hypothetical protein [Candidatus Omnitrophota bacterium]MCB9720287.1 hypothetical protein [Candidatus Omnitrophota bacterium]
MKVFRSLLAAVMVAALTVSPAHADEVAELRAMIEDMRRDYETRIEMLEGKIERLEAGQEEAVDRRVAEVREELKEEIRRDTADGGWKAQYVGRYEGDFQKGGFEVESPAGMAKVTVGGYMDHEFENFENTDSTFDQHRWIINVGAQLGERLRFFSEYEIEHGGPDAAGGGEAKVEQAYIDYLITEWINLRFGALLVPFGRTNIYHDSDLRDLTSRPLVARDIIPTTWTESGAAFFGEFAPVIGAYEDLVVNYEVQVINGLNDGFSDTGLGGARGSLSSDNNNNKAVAGRVVLSPALGHEVGLSGYYGAYNEYGDSISGKGVDFLSTWGPLELTGEYAYFKVNAPEFAASGITDIADEFEGYHIQAAYHFWPAFLDETFLGRTFEDPVFTLVGRYGWARIDDDADAGTGDNEEDRWTLGINYRPVESWVMKLEYQWNDTENEALERGKNDGWFWSVAMGF